MYLGTVYEIIKKSPKQIPFLKKNYNITDDQIFALIWMSINGQKQKSLSDDDKKIRVNII